MQARMKNPAMILPGAWQGIQALLAAARPVPVTARPSGGRPRRPQSGARAHAAAGARGLGAAEQYRERGYPAFKRA